VLLYNHPLVQLLSKFGSQHSCAVLPKDAGVAGVSRIVVGCANRGHAEPSAWPLRYLVALIFSGRVTPNG
jgi:hypothetical protein